MKLSVGSLALVLAASTEAFVVPTKTVRPTSKLLPEPAQGGIRSTATVSTQLNVMPTMMDGAIKTAALTTESITSSPLFTYFIETIISYSVPTVFSLIVIFFAASSFNKGKKGGPVSFFDGNTVASELYDDLYGDTKEASGPAGGFMGFGGNSNKSKAQRRNLGIPSTEYLKVTNLNSRYDSYDFSLTKATQSKALAAAQYRSRSFDRALSIALVGDDEDSSLPTYSKTMLLEAEKTFLTKGKALVGEIQALEAALAQDAIDTELKRQGLEKFEMDPKPDSASDATETEGDLKNATHSSKAESKSFGISNLKFGKSSQAKLQEDLAELRDDLQSLELEFLQAVIAAVGTKRGLAIRTALVGDTLARGSGSLLKQLEERPLSALLSFKGESAPEGSQKKKLFVMNFPGDVQASQLNELREEVTAVIRNAKPGDEAMVVLQSGGGTVTGYGLAAGQLVRLKDAGLPLTMAVEQVAASGGYMMACVADRIVASPFAVLGSIGVISEIPNAYERLKQEGIEFQTVTAGKFKRTLTPTKRVTKLDLEKSKEDLEQVLTQFAGFVKENRPALDMDSVATGETWFGNAALEKGLCDEIQTVDDLLLGYVDRGFDVYEIDYSPPAEVPAGLAQLLPSTSGASRDSNSWPRKAIRWMVNMVADEVRAAVAEQTSVENRYMAKDETSKRLQMRD